MRDSPMTRKAQNMQHESGSGRSRKMRGYRAVQWLQAAFLAASLPKNGRLRRWLRAPGIDDSKIGRATE